MCRFNIHLKKIMLIYRDRRSNPKIPREPQKSAERVDKVLSEDVSLTRTREVTEISPSWAWYRQNLLLALVQCWLAVHVKKLATSLLLPDGYNRRQFAS